MREIDKATIEMAAGGDMKAFEDIYRQFSSTVYTITLGVTRNRQDAEEATQDVFVKIFRGLKDFQFGVWQKIRAEISAAPVRRYSPGIILEHARYYLSHLRPALVIASAAVLLLFALVVARFMPYRDYLETTAMQDDILAISYTGDEENGAEYDLGTGVEMFFL